MQVAIAFERGRRAHAIATLAVVTGLYVLAGKIGLALAFVHASTTAVWPPAGIAVAALLLLGRGAWPAIALGAFIVNMTTSGDLASSLLIAAGNTGEAVAAAAFATRFARGRFFCERPADILRFTVYSAMASSTIAATVGTLALRITGLAAPGTLQFIWVTWWLGDAVGIIVFVPLLAVFTTSTMPWRGSTLEAVALVSTLVIIGYIVFGDSPAGSRNVPLAFLMVPILLWSAFRFGSRTTAVLSVAMCVVALWGTLRRHGPFGLDQPSESLLIVQAFVGVLTPLMLAVAAEVAVRRRIEIDMRVLNDTLEKRVAARTEELTRVYDRLLEAQRVAHVGSWEWNIPEDSLWWSDEMCRIFGVARPPGDYDRYLSCVHADDRERTHALVERALQTGSAFSFEHQIVRPDGEVRVLHARGRVESDAAGRPIRLMGIGHDITERRRAEEQRAQLFQEHAARREAEDANRAKDAFLATLSHELRTPLNAALGWAQIVRDAVPVEDRVRRAIEAIYRNLMIQARLVSDILDISRITKGSLPLENDLVDLTTVIDAAIDTIRESARARRVTIDVRAEGVPTVIGDSRRLQQVVWNLLSNAVKFCRDGGHVTVTVADRSDAVHLVVEDDGPGIAPEFLPHVFEQFRQADASVTREYGGLGLGLAIAHHIVDMHRGTIEVDNRPSGGAIFTVRLPSHRRSGTPDEPGAGGMTSKVSAVADIAAAGDLNIPAPGN